MKKMRGKVVRRGNEKMKLFFPISYNLVDPPLFDLPIPFNLMFECALVREREEICEFFPCELIGSVITRN